MFVDSSLSTYGTTSATIEQTNTVLQPPIDDDDDVLLKYKMQKQRESKEKEKTDEPTKVVKTYTTRSMEKKLLGDAIKASKSATTKKRRPKRV